MIRDYLWVDQEGYKSWVRGRSSTPCLQNLGYALAVEDRTEEADAAFVRAIELDPSYVKAKVNLRLLREGRALGPESGR
jgi:hypothetical protein